MDVTRGCAGSRENVARHVRPASSGHAIVTESSARTTVIGPGCTRVMSSGTDTAAAGLGIRIRIARNTLRMANTLDVTSRRSPGFVAAASRRLQRLLVVRTQ